MKTFLKWLVAHLTDPENPAPRVILFGAIGGVLSVLASLVHGEFKQSWWVVFPYLALGAGAAIAAVFVLLGIKTEDVWRCCGVALLAGFFWQPIFDASKDYLLNQPERAAEAETAKVADQLETTLTNLVHSPTNTAYIERVGTLTETLTRETPELRRSPVKTRAQLLVTHSMDVLTQHAEKGHPSALGAVMGVAEAAATSGNLPVADKARSQINRLPDPTNKLLQIRKQEIMTRIPMR